MTTTPDGASGQQVRSGAMEIRGASHRDITGPRTRQEITEWASGEVGRPFFLFIHLWDVHYDYIPPPEYVELFDPEYDGELAGEDFSTNPMLRPEMPVRDLERLIALYDGEIRFTDDILGEIFDGLDRAGLLEAALVVITSDHGEEFFEHDGKGHQRTLFEEVLRVPLIVRWPGRIPGGRVVSDQVRLIDLLPTFARVAGFEGELAIQGRDIMPLLAGEHIEPEAALAELLVNRRSTRVLRTNRLKVLQIRHDDPVLLYRLDEDPGEHAPLGPGGPHEDERRRMAAELAGNLERARELGRVLQERSVDAIELDEEMLERLRGLGYLESDAGS